MAVDAQPPAVFMTSPERLLEARDVATGALRWSSAEAVRPLAAAVGRVLAQADGAAGRLENWQEAVVVDGVGAVHRTTDAGATWRDITFNLASFNPGTLRSAGFVPVGPGAALVGADRGVFMLRLNTTTWDILGTGLPNAPVFELDYDAARDKLMAGLLGRGSWLLTPVAPEVPVELQWLEIR